MGGGGGAKPLDGGGGGGRDGPTFAFPLSPGGGGGKGRPTILLGLPELDEGGLPGGGGGAVVEGGGPPLGNGGLGTGDECDAVRDARPPAIETFGLEVSELKFSSSTEEVLKFLKRLEFKRPGAPPLLGLAAPGMGGGGRPPLLLLLGAAGRAADPYLFAGGLFVLGGGSGGATPLGKLLLSLLGTLVGPLDVAPGGLSAGPPAPPGAEMHNF